MENSRLQRQTSDDCFAAGRASDRGPLRSDFLHSTALHRLRPVRFAVFLRGIVRPVTGCTLAVVMLLVSIVVAAGPRGSLASFNRARQTFGQGRSCGIFTIKPRLRLDPVTVKELTGCDSKQALSGGDFRFGDGGFHLLDLRSMVTRSVPGLWRLRMPPDARLYALDVSYELVGANGRSSRLCNLDKSESEIKVIIDEIPPRVVGREAHSTLIEGGMVMHLQLEAVRSAGTYSGTLTVVVNHF